MGKLERYEEERRERPTERPYASTAVILPTSGGIKEKTSLVRLGIKALIARESSKRLAKLKGTEKKLEMITRGRAEGE